MTTISLEEAQSRLREIVEKLGPGEEVMIVSDEHPVAKLIGESATVGQRPAPGLGKGTIVYMSPDFDAPLDEFKEYME